MMTTRFSRVMRRRDRTHSLAPQARPTPASAPTTSLSPIVMMNSLVFGLAAGRPDRLTITMNESLDLEEDPPDFRMLLANCVLQAVHRLDEFLGRQSVRELDIQVEQDILGSQVHGEGRPGTGDGRVGL